MQTMEKHTCAIESHREHWVQHEKLCCSLLTVVPRLDQTDLAESNPIRNCASVDIKILTRGSIRTMLGLSRINFIGLY